MATVIFGYGEKQLKLTTDHAASSYGVPVLVDGDKVYGASDVYVIATQNVGSAWGEVKVPITACSVAQAAAITPKGEWMPKGTLHRDLFDKFAATHN